MNNKVQTVNCKCGAVMLACSEPFCYEDKAWLSDLSKWIKKGYKIDLIKQSELPSDFGNCTCTKQEKLQI